MLVAPSQPPPPSSSLHTARYSHPLQQPRRRRQQRSDAETPQYHRPLEVIDISTFPICDTETRADDPDDAEGCEEDPSRLTTEAVAEEYEYVGDEDDGVDHQFDYAEFFVGFHDARSKGLTMLASTYVCRFSIWLFIAYASLDVCSLISLIVRENAIKNPRQTMGKHLYLPSTHLSI